MSHRTDWDIEKHRSPHEPSHHWDLKRRFMMAHKDMMPELELVGLAQTLGNIEFMGCTYPSDTMKRVRELAKGIVEEFREMKKGKLQRTFVSGSEAANSKVNRLPGVKRSQTEETSIPAKKTSKYGNFVASSSSIEEPVNKEIEGFILPPKNTSVKPSNDFMGFCNDIINKSKGGVGETGNRNNLFKSLADSNNSNDIDIIEDESDQMPICFAYKSKGKCTKKHCSFKHAEPDNKKPVNNKQKVSYKQNEENKGSNKQKEVNKVSYKPNYQLHFDEQRSRYEESLNEALPPGFRRHLQLDRSQPLHNFIVVTLAYHDDEKSCNVLQRSAGFCKIPVNWDYSGPIGNITCTVKVGGQEVCSSFASSKPEARDLATQEALELLQSQCYTIQVKSQYLSDGTKVDMMDVSVNTQVGGKAQALSTSNVGHKLLSLMGWGGGGLGKEGAGRAEPVTATTVFGREGLGSVGATQNFKLKIKKVVEDWMTSFSPYDLVFTTGFDNEQRKEMHQVARRLGLKSKSFGKDEERHLTISKKFDGVSLLEELLRRGGETEKYTLIPPSTQ